MVELIEYVAFLNGREIFYVNEKDGRKDKMNHLEYEHLSSLVLPYCPTVPLFRRVVRWDVWGRQTPP